MSRYNKYNKHSKSAERGGLFTLFVMMGGMLAGLLSGCALAHGASTIARPAPAASVSTTGSAISCPAIPVGQPDDFLTCQYFGPHNARMTFYLYPPRGYTPQQTQQEYPLTLILQGVGERADPKKTAAQNRAAALNQQYVGVWGPGSPVGGPSVQSQWPEFVVVPQVEDPNRWVNISPSVTKYALAPQPTQSLQMAVTIVALVQQEYTAVDHNRLYVTGLSMGGFGVWDAIERWPTLFAAAVPVAGAGDPAVAGRIANLPLWDFHGGADAHVPVQGSRNMIQAIQAAGGSPCYTEYAGKDHVVWPQVYALSSNMNNPLYPWLFAQSKTGPAPNAPACNQAT